ncbi:MAG: hypothetical protein M3Q56_01645 [Bacteroidota bacterium]|nr:hypothetical protein [Bacteroidota bacterium]
MKCYLKHVGSFLISLLLVLFSSCQALKNEVWFNADESGRMEITFDIGALVEGFSEKIQELNTLDSTGNESKQPAELEQEEITHADPMSDPISPPIIETQMPDKKKSSIQKFFDRLQDSKAASVDTSVLCSTLFPDSIKLKLERPYLLRKVGFHVKFREDSAIALLRMGIDFIHLSQIDEILSEIEKAEQLETGVINTESSMKESFILGNQIQFKPEEGLLIIPAEDMLKKMNMTEKEVDDFALMKPEELESFKKIFGLGTIETIYHLPGKVKSVEGVKHYKKDDYTVVFQYDMFDFLMGKKIPEHKIHFQASKKKKKRA